jgi:ppGpp synthetase/RelA/SpoT-type nucleotidyltranferase
MASFDSTPAETTILERPWMAKTSTPKVIADFIENYNYSHEEEVCKKAADLVLKGLNGLKDGNGQTVQAKVSSRAKKSESLEEKLRMRYEEKEKKEGGIPYESEEDIRNDIVDFSGVRILLYTANQLQYDSVKRMIQGIWGSTMEPKVHPDPDRKTHKQKEEQYVARHEGYRAFHYRVSMRKGRPSKEPYAWKSDDMVEVQVISALGHAWSEAEHDIKYKTEAYGEPTEAEERLLDALSGLVSSGELILEQLMKSVNKRTSSTIQHREDLESVIRGLDVFRGRHICTDVDWFAVKALDLLFDFLAITEPKLNNPLQIRQGLKILGYPGNPLSKMRMICKTFEPMFEPVREAMAPLCLIRHWYLEHRRELSQRMNLDLIQIGDQDDPDYNRIAFEEAKLTLKCAILAQTLESLRTFGGSKEGGEFLVRQVRHGQGGHQIKSVEFLLDHPTTDPLYINLGSPQWHYLEPLWEWFTAQTAKPESICGMLFLILVARYTGEYKCVRLATCVEVFEAQSLKVVYRTPEFSRSG